MDIRSAQKRAWQNKVAKGFNTTDIPLEFCLLQADLQAILGAKVDLVPASDLKPAVRARAEPELVPL